MAVDTPFHGGIYPTYLYVHDFDTAKTELVSRDELGDPVGSVLYSAFSGDGTTVAYDDGDGYVIRDIGSGSTIDVPIPSNVTLLNRTALSKNGVVLAYFADLESGHTQVHGWDSSSNTTTLLSRSSSGQPANLGVLANTFSPGGPALAGDGQWAAFTSVSTNLGAPEPGGFENGEAEVAHVFLAEASPGS
jgi:hypothetical protein